MPWSTRRPNEARSPPRPRAATYFESVTLWTSTARGGGTHEIRGGSFNNIEGGRACDFDFTVAADAFAFPNTGFRCCYVP